MSEPACECPGPGNCPRYRRDMNEYTWSVCSGRGMPGFPTTPERSEHWRRKWRLDLDEPPGGPPPAAPPSRPVATPAPAGGPGTELKKLLASLGLTAGDCSCTSRAARMDREGPAWCRANRAEIVAWLRAEAAKRSWWEKAKAAVLAVTTFRIDPLDPYGSLVDEAIRRTQVS